MKKILLTALTLSLLCGCTKEPQFVNIEELMDEVLAEMDFYGTDEDALLTEEDPADGDTVTGEADDLLSDD